MDIRDYWLIKLMEECGEVIQRAAKQIQFGRDEMQVGQPHTNGTRLREELMDLFSVARQLTATGMIGPIDPAHIDEHIRIKESRLAKYLQLSRELGMVVEDDRRQPFVDRPYLSDLQGQGHQPFVPPRAKGGHGDALVLPQWRHIATAPDNKRILVRGPSGYANRTFIITARTDLQFRPPINGVRRWLDDTDTDLADRGWEPHEWTEIPQ